MNRYLDMREEQKQSHPNESGDCAVKAVAIAAEVSYVESHKAVAEVYDRKDGKGTYWFSNPPNLKKLLSKFGKKPVLVNNENVKTPKSAAWYLTDGNYICNIRGHLLAVVDGAVEDWTRGRKFQIWAIWKIVDIDDTPTINFTTNLNFNKYVDSELIKHDSLSVYIDGFYTMRLYRRCDQDKWVVMEDETKTFLGSEFYGSLEEVKKELAIIFNAEPVSQPKVQKFPSLEKIRAGEYFIYYNNNRYWVERDDEWWWHVYILENDSKVALFPDRFDSKKQATTRLYDYFECASK